MVDFGLVVVCWYTIDVHVSFSLCVFRCAIGNLKHRILFLSHTMLIEVLMNPTEKSQESGSEQIPRLSGVHEHDRFWPIANIMTKALPLPANGKIAKTQSTNSSPRLSALSTTSAYLFLFFFPS